jgi:hypothetical protein
LPEPDSGSPSATDPDSTNGWGRLPSRLRDLQGRERGLALGMFVLVLVPFAVALVRAFHDGWIPSGDEANIATRAFDVFSRHPPLTGLPSTSHKYGEAIPANHPGPMEFYLLAAPLRVLGMSVGPLLTAAVINAGCVLVALWVFFRRLGLTAMLWAGVLLLAVMWSAGTSVLTDTLSSNMTMYSVLASAVLAWALIDGDLRLLPLAAFVASYAAQQHLAAGVIVAVLFVVVLVAMVVGVVSRARRGDTAITRMARRWGLASVAVAGVSWFPVLYDQFSHHRDHPGNLSQIVRFARDNTRPTVGTGSAVDQTLHGVVPPTILGRTDTSGLFFLQSLSVVRLVVGFAVVAALIAIVWAARHRARPLARLAFVALVVLVAVFVNGSNVPASEEAWRVNLYRSSWTAAFVTWTAIGIGTALLARHALGERPLLRRAQQHAPLTLTVIAALIATSVVFVQGADDHNRERPAFDIEKRIAAAVLDKIDRTHPVFVVDHGYAATISIRPYLVLRLVEAGFTVEVPDSEVAFYGGIRGYRARESPSALVIVSGQTIAPSKQGTVLTTQEFNPERSALIAQLAAEARGHEVELTSRGAAIIEREYPGFRKLYFDPLFAKVPTDPRVAIEQDAFLRLVLDGAIRAPVLDRAKVQRLLELPSDDNTIGGDEQVQVRLLTPDEVRANASSEL